MERKPYKGLKRKLVLAFDVGTTFSGVSYCVLDPGSVPEMRGVTRFPAQEQVGIASKIPTIIYYDQAGEVRAVGAEAVREGVFEEAEENGWVKVEWFKLHVRPRKSASTSEISAKIPPLPPNKSVTDVLADYLSYLFTCAKSYVRVTHANGAELWDSVKDNIDFVLSHPNGWEGYQQAQIRRAVVRAGLIGKSEDERVSLISEGEASLWFALKHGLPKEAMERGEGVVVIDAGGGTIDISTYRKPTGGNKFEEIASPRCHFQGSVFVNINARLFLERFLKDSEYLNELDHIVECFDKTTKVRFSDDTLVQYIKFGSTKDRDDEVGIRFGQLKLSGRDVATFFKQSVRCMIFLGQVFTSSSMPCWLKELRPLGLTVMRPDLYVGKAVSDGAIAFHLSSQIQARTAKYDYGVIYQTHFNPGDPDHISRRDGAVVLASGQLALSTSCFEVVLKKAQILFPISIKRLTNRQGTRLSNEDETILRFSRVEATSKELRKVLRQRRPSIYCYSGHLENPRFVDMDQGELIIVPSDPTDNFWRLCAIDADLSHLPLTRKRTLGGDGYYYTIDYCVVLKISRTELKAQVAWLENGEEVRSPASIIFYPD